MVKTWTIVIFTEEDSVEIVPSNWIIDGKCYWPSFTSEKLTAAVKNHIRPDCSWPLYPIRLIRNGTFDNYTVAKKKCRKAEYSSDVNSDKSFGNKRRVTKKTYGSSFEENLSSSDDNNNVLNKLPTPPRLTNDTSIFTKTNLTTKTNLKRNNDEVIDFDSRNEKQGNLLQSNDNESLTNNDQLETFMTKCKCCPVHLKHKCKSYFKEIIRQQNMLKASMWQYTDTLNELTISINRLLTNDGKVAHREQEAPLFFKIFSFPIQNEEEVIRVDEYLNDDKNFNVAMNELSKIGGSSVYNYVQRALKMLITNDLAATYSWLGRRSKKAFNKLKLADLIIGSVKKNIPNSTNKECEEAIQKWLRRADNKKHRDNNVDTA